MIDKFIDEANRVIDASKSNLHELTDRINAKKDELKQLQTQRDVFNQAARIKLVQFDDQEEQLNADIEELTREQTKLVQTLEVQPQSSAPSAQPVVPEPAKQSTASVPITVASPQPVKPDIVPGLKEPDTDSTKEPAKKSSNSILGKVKTVAKKAQF